MPTKSFFSSKVFFAIVAVVLIAGSFGVGYSYSQRKVMENALASVANKDGKVATTADFAPFWKAWQVLNEKFVVTKSGEPTTDQQKVWGAIEGLASSLGDPYTVFMPPQETKSFEEEISGNFEGVGMEIGIKDDILTVVAPLKNSPAEKAGVRTGDKIVQIDGKSTLGMKVDEAVKIIRGKKGTIVTLNLLREGRAEPFDVKVTRDVINFPTLDSELRTDGIYVIKLYNFSAISANLFERAILEFQKYQAAGKAKALVLDLRGNPGGYLDAAVDMASWFLEKGEVVVREDFGGGAQEEVRRSSGYHTFGGDFKMVVLINGGSASASEILAGALKEHGIATLIGQKSFGKGSVQELVRITDDTNLKVTIARWLTPKGNSISEVGIAPDVEVKPTDADLEKGKDPVMEKAVQFLLDKKAAAR